MMNHISMHLQWQILNGTGSDETQCAIHVYVIHVNIINNLAASTNNNVSSACVAAVTNGDPHFISVQGDNLIK